MDVQVHDQKYICTGIYRGTVEIYQVDTGVSRDRRVKTARRKRHKKIMSRKFWQTLPIEKKNVHVKKKTKKSLSPGTILGPLAVARPVP